MLVHCFTWGAFIRVIGGLNAANFAAFLIVDVVNVEGILLRDGVGNTEKLGGPVIALYSLTFGTCFVQFAAYVHTLVREYIQALEFFAGCPARMAQVGHQGTAPRLLQNNSTVGRIGVTGCQHVWVEHRVEQAVAMNSGTMLVSEFGRLPG